MSAAPDPPAAHDCDDAIGGALERRIYMAPRGFVALSLAVTEVERDHFVDGLAGAVRGIPTTAR